MPRICVILLTLLSAVPGFTYPSCLNIIPSADCLPLGTLRIQAELDGDPTPFATGALLHVYTQAGLTSRLEVGLDAVDVTHETDWQLNAKYRLWEEGQRRPAAAIGLLDLDGNHPLDNAYFVLSRRVGPVRVHGGLWRVDGTRGMLGAEYYWDPKTGALVDWTTGSHTYATLGLYRSLRAAWHATLYYARSNTDRREDFVGLNLYSDLTW